MRNFLIWIANTGGEEEYPHRRLPLCLSSQWFCPTGLSLVCVANLTDFRDFWIQHSAVATQISYQAELFHPSLRFTIHGFVFLLWL
jgi:hypothetical protein